MSYHIIARPHSPSLTPTPTHEVSHQNPHRNLRNLRNLRNRSFTSFNHYLPVSPPSSQLPAPTHSPTLSQPATAVPLRVWPGWPASCHAPSRPSTAHVAACQCVVLGAVEWYLALQQRVAASTRSDHEVGAVSYIRYYRMRGRIEAQWLWEWEWEGRSVVVRSFVRSVVLSRSFVRSVAHSFAHSFGCSFVRSFVRSFSQGESTTLTHSQYAKVEGRVQCCRPGQFCRATSLCRFVVWCGGVAVALLRGRTDERTTLLFPYLL